MRVANRLFCSLGCQGTALFCTSPVPPTLLLPARETSEPAPTVTMGLTFPYCLTVAVHRRPDFLRGARQQGAAGREPQPGRGAGLTRHGNGAGHRPPPPGRPRQPSLPRGREVRSERSKNVLRRSC